MKPSKLLLLLAVLLGPGTSLAQAEKFSSSLYQDTGSSISDQTVPVMSQIPQQISGTKMPKTASTTFPETVGAQPAMPEMPSAEANPPVGAIPSMEMPAISPPNTGFQKQIAPAIKSPFEVRAPKISSPDLEAKFRKLQQQQQEEKTKKKKKLSDAIREELVNYGLFFLLGLAAILLVYALRKDNRPSKPHVDAPAEPAEKVRDIWKEEF